MTKFIGGLFCKFFTSVLWQSVLPWFATRGVKQYSKLDTGHNPFSCGTLSSCYVGGSMDEYLKKFTLHWHDKQENRSIVVLPAIR